MPSSDQYKDFSKLFETYIWEFRERFARNSVQACLINLGSLEITDPEDQKVKHNAPDIIYPEFIIVADYNIYK